MNNLRSNSTPGHMRQQFGNYKLIWPIGRGGFADVSLGEHIYLKTQAAVKTLRAEQVSVDEGAFLGEARIIAHLKHPHIVRVLEFGLEGPVPYLAMEYASNGSLRQNYPPGARLTPKTVLKYVGQIAEALQYIHDSGFIHRDIKPENLLLDAHNKLLLGDFGITIAAHQVSDSERIGVGTIAYMAPEQIDGDPCKASDQYALGIVVYEWLCGATPFQGSVNEIARQHFEELPPSLCASVPIVPLAAERVIFKALAKDPRDRFASVPAFAEALQKAFEPQPVVLRDNGQQPRQVPAIEPVSALSKPGREKFRGKKPVKRNIWQEITTCFTIDLLAGAALGCGLYVLHMVPPQLELLVALYMVLFPLGYALLKDNRQLCMLTCGIAVAAAVIALLFQAVSMFLIAIIVFLLLSLLTTFTVSVNG